MRNNTFKLNSHIKEIEKELAKAEKKHLAKAANLFKRRLRAKIKSLNLVDGGNLLKGVSSVALDHASLVGMSAPAFHALLVEYGTTDRKTDSEYHNKKGIEHTGSTKKQPYFLPTFQETLPDIQKILSEEWV